jgi:hypothetical protein
MAVTVMAPLTLSAANFTWSPSLMPSSSRLTDVQHGKTSRCSASKRV